MYMCAYCLQTPLIVFNLWHDISVNKPAKEFLRKQFQQWYSEKVLEQITQEGVDAANITPIKLEMPILKELMAKWLVKMAEYLADNPHFIVNGFRKSGIPGALDGLDEQNQIDEIESDEYSDSDEEYDEDGDSEDDSEDSDEILSEEENEDSSEESVSLEEEAVIIVD